MSNDSPDLDPEVEALCACYSSEELALLVALLNAKLDQPQTERVLDTQAQQRYADLVVAIHVFFEEMLRAQPILEMPQLRRFLESAERIQRVHERSLPDVAAFIEANPRYHPQRKKP